ncbi:DUF6387 family protein [Azotobacter chroococcum]|jgi:hypothetical protein|uniref:DUF6387 family protein n=1 Tax=Azotobacter chroococcum TaxID=353 RepID=UPI0012FDAB08|nr:DUF6387 family protein [Azotobacter chroococcum]
MAKIDRVEELPEWFNLEKYQEAESFGAPEWHYELSRRSQLFNIGQRYKSNPSKIGEAETSMFKRHAEYVRQNPIGIMKFDSADLELEFMPVKSIRTFDLRMQAHRDERAKKHGLCHPSMAARWAAIGDPTYSIKSAVEVTDLPIEIDFYDSRPPSAVVKVDLSASDTKLKAAFEVWLKAARKNQKTVTTKLRKPLYARWVRYGLLPYLDLLIWAMETNIHIPDRVMSAAISRYDAGEANLRKTIAPLAADIMRDLSELETFAFLETATRTLAKLETVTD